jgi:hypothetical protein
VRALLLACVGVLRIALVVFKRHLTVGCILFRCKSSLSV